MLQRQSCFFLLRSGLCAVLCLAAMQFAKAQSRYAASDNLSGYVHWIELIDDANNRIDPNAENPPPYSPEKTCGRCHDFNAISHGWHFNSVDESLHGRPGQPWIWSDPRTGTHLPLSYRGWKGTLNPDQLGLSRWEVAAKFGGFLPGGGPGSSESLRTAVAPAEGSETVDRSHITGSLPVDCMLCHHRPGSGYSPFVWTEQIEDQNFAYAPTAAVGIATVSGSNRRLKDDFDPTAEGAAQRLPRVKYESERFRQDQKVFFDLIRKPDNSACYYCHSNISADSVTGSRWLHDDDVHLRAGFQCADCHRNGLDHHTVRGYDDERHPAGSSIASLSCQGCHVGSREGEGLQLAGRLGAPLPRHRGIPSLHFEKMTCTSCHSGPAVEATVGRQLNSIAHRLGTHVKRTGEEFPGIVSPVLLPVDYQSSGDPPLPASSESVRFTPHRMMWPSYWGIIREGTIEVLNPERAYELVRRALKVRREFTEELAEVKLSLSQRAAVLGEERARAKPEQWTESEQQKIAQAEAVERETQIAERMAKALAEIEQAYPGTRAVYVSGGAGFTRDGESNTKPLDIDPLQGGAEPYAWPLAHNVRPARMALGADGCTQCHGDEAPFFHTEITPVGLLPNQKTTPFKAHQHQQVDMFRQGNWNQLFRGRSTFKILGLVAIGLTSLITMSAIVSNLNSYIGRGKTD